MIFKIKQKLGISLRTFDINIIQRHVNIHKNNLCILYKYRFVFFWRFQTLTVHFSFFLFKTNEYFVDRILLSRRFIEQGRYSTSICPLSLARVQINNKKKKTIM